MTAKLAQALAYGATVLQVQGGFDQAMTLVERACDALDVYLLNSVNPWRIEGQKAIGLEILDDLNYFQLNGGLQFMFGGGADERTEP